MAVVGQVLKQTEERERGLLWPALPQSYSPLDREMKSGLQYSCDGCNHGDQGVDCG
jgi:hypothetical protein